MNLLVDIGNSRIKWGYIESDNLVTGCIDHKKEDYLASLKDIWKQFDCCPSHLALACVSKKTIEISLVNMVMDLWPNIRIHSVKTSYKTHGVSNGYKIPELLGVDRWLGLIAAHRLYNEAVCIVDLGTAITIDVMNESGKHLGGVISPGLSIMKKSMHLNTANLPMIDSSYPVALADSTEAAINAGSIFAVVGLIHHTFKMYAGDSKLILTGGDAHEIAPFIEYEHVIELNLILHGLAIMLEE